MTHVGATAGGQACPSDRVSAWYPGQVLPITALRPRTIIKDEAIPALLRGAAQPTFVTINITDFWELVRPHRNYCIITVALPKERIPEIPHWLRRLFRLPEFKSKRARILLLCWRR